MAWFEKSKDDDAQPEQRPSLGKRRHELAAIHRAVVLNLFPAVGGV